MRKGVRESAEYTCVCDSHGSGESWRHSHGNDGRAMDCPGHCIQPAGLEVGLWGLSNVVRSRAHASITRPYHILINNLWGRKPLSGVMMTTAPAMAVARATHHGASCSFKDTVKFAEEKDKAKKESELTQLLERGDVKELLRQMTSGNIEGIPIMKKSLAGNPTKSSETANQEKFAQKTAKSLFPSILCGAIPAFCTANPFANKSQPNVPDVPMVIHANKSIDHLAIPSIMSSVSESTDGSYEEDME